MFSKKKIKNKLEEWIAANDTRSATIACEYTAKLFARKIDDAGILSRMSEKDQLEFMAITTQMIAGSQSQTVKTMKKLKALLEEDEDFEKFIRDLYYQNSNIDKYRKEWTK